jgi:coenzyme F420-0:L-glutamate ligase/coenzyme F420-1:gamma-L-glutamate ligase
MSDLHLLGVTGIPEVKTGDGLADLIARNTTLQTDDVVVVTSKIVSKAEGNIVILDGAAETARIASQAVRVLRRQDGHAISETAHGFICADAGVTTSNVEPGSVALLPRDPDRTAFKIRERLRAIAGVDVGVIIADAFVRAWRNGVAGVALGSCGITPVEESTQLCVVDQLPPPRSSWEPTGAFPSWSFVAWIPPGLVTEMVTSAPPSCARLQTNSFADRASPGLQVFPSCATVFECPQHHPTSWAPMTSTRHSRRP